MTDFIQVADTFYVRASSGHVDDRTHVLKCDDAFAVFDRRGDIHPHGRGHQGLYWRGTRFLSRLELTLNGAAPLLLSSATKADSSEVVVDATNQDLMREGNVVLTAMQVHVSRTIMLSADACHQRLVVRNHAACPIEVTLALQHDADFRDVFEVRGTNRARRGEILPPQVETERVVLRYRGLDDVVRAVRIAMLPAPDRLTPSASTFNLRLEPHEQRILELECRCGFGAEFGTDGARPDHRAAVQHQRERARSLRAGMACWRTEGRCDDWLERSEADLQLMLAPTDDGWYPHAGVPWYATVFGRDGLLTAFECLLVAPRIARGVLGHLAALQAREDDDAHDAMPGKILHERRDGEMAALDEIPFGRYYGSVDATPLFVLLAGHYWRRTGDLAFVGRLWPALDAALQWCERSATDGFVTYQRHSERGLANQGWKDSHDAVFHADGTLATGPIALCEVQGYVYAARVLAAELADALGRSERATDLRAAAERLRIAFEARFWCEEQGTYALALDGAGRPCRVRTSNPGHCLFAGIAAPARAAHVVASLLADDMWSGFGIRTVSDRETRFNPMAYHNGSVWPHDNALIAYGMARYGFGAEALRVFTAMRDASQGLELRRLPELFCGFARQPDRAPTLYPVACSPQAWAVAAPFLLLQACLGIEVDALRGEVVVDRPCLPDWLSRVTLTSLAIAGEEVDLEFRRRADSPHSVEVQSLRGTVPVRVRH